MKKKNNGWRIDSSVAEIILLWQKVSRAKIIHSSTGRCVIYHISQIWRILTLTFLQLLPTYVLFVTCYHKETACYSVSLSSCTSQILAGSISASQSISQLYNETPLPLTHRDKDVPLNPKVSASSPRCHLALLSLPPRTSVTPPFPLFFQNSV